MGVNEDSILASVLALLPPGDALPAGHDTELAKLLRVTARAIDRLEGAGLNLLEEIDPRVTSTFIEDWERLLGLPGCGSIPETANQRRAEILEKYTRVGDLTAASLISAAAEMGFTITITEPQTSPNEHVFAVNLPSLTVRYFEAGTARAGESLGSFGDAGLTCLLDERKPAHTNYALTTP